MLCTCTAGSLDPVLGKDRLHFVPQGLIDDCRMFSGIGLAFVRSFTTVNSVLKHQIERPPGEFLATVVSAVGSYSLLASDPLVFKCVL